MGQYYIPIFINRNGNPIATLDRCYAFGEGAKLMEHSYFNKFVGTAIDYIRHNPKSRLVWSGDYADDTCKVYDKEQKKWITTNLYNKVDNNPKVDIYPQSDETYKGWYIINHTKREYIKYTSKNGISPLPILTSSGNGRGGGDYQGNNMPFVGYWSGDLLSVVESEEEIPKGFKLKEYEFEEE